MLPLQIAVVLVLIASGVLLVAALRISRKLRLELAHHVNLVAERSLGELKEAPRFPISARLAWINQAARRVFSIGVPYLWGMQSSGMRLLGIAAAAGGGVWVLGYLIFGHSVWIACPLGALAFFVVPRKYLGREQRRTEQQFLEQLPSAIDMIVRMARAGLPVTSAVHSVGIEAAPPLNKVFELIANQVELGVPFENALDVVSQRIGIPDFRFFSVAVTLQHGTGGNLAATLEILSDVIRKRRAIRLKAVAATAEVRVSAYVLGGMPIIVIGLLFLLKPEYVAPLVNDHRGKYILATAFALLGVGFWIMQRMMHRVTTI
jgi:tight adherence protein B